MSISAVNVSTVQPRQQTQTTKYKPHQQQPVSTPADSYIPRSSHSANQSATYSIPLSNK